MYPVRIVKMVTGETLIAGIADSVNPHGNQGVYTLEEPMTIVQIPTRKKNNNVSETLIFMKRWLEFSQDEMFIVPKSSVVCVAIPDNGILRDYMQAKVSLELEEGEEDDGDEDEGGEEGDFEGDQNDNPTPPFE
jgi:hypothetical protein